MSGSKTTNPTPSVVWQPWEQIERLFKYHGVKYVLQKNYAMSRLGKVDKHNRARHTNSKNNLINEESVDSMTGAAYGPGLVIPALVGYMRKDPPPVEEGGAPPPDTFIADGYNRRSALRKLGVETVWIYIIDASFEMIDELTRQINLYVGRRSTPAEQMANAVHVARERAARLGAAAPNRETIDEVAAIYYVNPQALATAIRLEMFTHHLDDPSDPLFTPDWDRLDPKIIAETLAVKDDKVAAALIRAFVELPTPPDGERLTAIVQSVSAAGRAHADKMSEAEEQIRQQRILANVKTGAATPKPPPSPPAALIMKSMTGLIRTLNKYLPPTRSASTLFDQPDYARLFVSKANGIIDELTRAVHELQTPEEDTNGSENGV